MQNKRRFKCWAFDIKSSFNFVSGFSSLVSCLRCEGFSAPISERSLQQRSQQRQRGIHLLRLLCPGSNSFNWKKSRLFRDNGKPFEPALFLMLLSEIARSDIDWLKTTAHFNYEISCFTIRFWNTQRMKSNISLIVIFIPFIINS